MSEEEITQEEKKRDIFRKAQERNKLNIAKKAAEGKTLRAWELAVLQAEDGIDFTPARSSNLVALSKYIGVSRVSLDNWRKKFKDFPKPNADGSYNNAESLAFCKNHGLKVNIKSDGEEEYIKPETEEDKKNESRVLAARAEMMEMKVKATRGSLIPVDVVDAKITMALGAFRSLLDAMPRDMAPKVNPSNPGFAEKALVDWRNNRVLPFLSDIIEKSKNVVAKGE